MRHPRITRRRTLTGAAGIVGATAVGGLGLLAAQPAAAASVNIQDTTVAVDDGDLSFVDLSLSDYTVTWRNFDVPVAAVAYHDVLELLDGSGGVTASHTLYDQRGVDAQPIQLANMSSQGDGSDGWGGPGEYASEDPDTYVQATGPATSGFVHADVTWRLLTDDPGTHGALSIEDPAVLGQNGWPSLDNPDDGTTKQHTLRLTKEVYLYALEDTGKASLTADDGSTTVYLMGADDGTRERVQAQPSFVVGVENEPATSSTDGNGSTSGG